MRAAKRHQPPSRLRYEAANPVIGVRLDRATYERVLKLREATGLSFGALFRDALGVVEKDAEVICQHARGEGVEIGRNIGRNEGYKEALAKYRIVYVCSDCEEEIPVLAGSKSAAAACDALTELGWGHASCHRRTRVS